MARKRVCGVCGKRIDADKQGYYDRHRQAWVCHKCAKQEAKDYKEFLADEREAKAGMRQTTGAMIAKIAVGALFICVGLFGGDMEFGARMVGLILGLALIAWGLLPWYKVYKAKKDAAAAEAAERAAAEAARLAEPWSCPACGAKTKGDACEYCGEPKP